jgi:hypothetical protein
LITDGAGLAVTVLAAAGLGAGVRTTVVAVLHAVTAAITATALTGPAISFLMTDLLIIPTTHRRPGSPGAIPAPSGKTPETGPLPGFSRKGLGRTT